MTHSLNSRIARFVCSGADSLLTLPAREQAIRAILDTIAVTIAGGAEPEVRALESSLIAQPGEGACRSPWSGNSYRADDAATLYGMASHMLDYDDVSMLAICHPSAPVLSALAAAATGGLCARPPSGGELLLAFGIGTEVMIRLGQAMGFRHYELGFHATATLGHVGAAAAVARLAGLGPERTAHALAIAASMSGGLQKNFGSMVKPLHAGLAAANALRAVRMAAAGVQGAAEPFESEGFLKAFSGGMTQAFPQDLAFGKPFAIERPGFEQKRYPCCYMLHKIIEATLAMKRETGCTLAQVKHALVQLPPGGRKPLIHPHPKSGLNGKFSGPYAVVAGLLDGKIDLASFVDEAVLRPEVQSRLADVEVVEESVAGVNSTDMGRAPVTVRLTLQDGSVLSHTVIPSPGSLEDPLTLPQLRQKWLDCFGRGVPRLSASAAGALFDEGLELESNPDAADWLARNFAH